MGGYKFAPGRALDVAPTEAPVRAGGGTGCGEGVASARDNESWPVVNDLLVGSLTIIEDAVQ